MKNADIFRGLEVVFVLFCLFFCLVVSLGQFVNQYPADGWFESQYRLTARFSGKDNYTPIAAPALFYRFIHLLAVIFGLTLPAELYLASIVQNLLLFFSVILIYLSNKCLEMDYIGIFVSFLMLLFIESTLLSQSFWSENVTIFLMSTILYIIIKVYTSPELSPRVLSFWGVALGLSLGAIVATRLTPIIVLPGLFVLFKGTFKKDKARFLVSVTIFFILIILGSMSANYYRFGRFELLGSTGRHLWNAISPQADVMLRNSTEYKLLKKYMPNIHGKEHWEIDPKIIDALVKFSDRNGTEELLKKLSFQAIRNRPDIFVRLGIGRFRSLLKTTPWRLGFYNPIYGRADPSKTEYFFPPLIPQFSGLRGLLDFSYRIIDSVYDKVLFISIYVILATLFLRVIFRFYLVLLDRVKLEHKFLTPLWIITFFMSSQILLIFWGWFFRYSILGFFYYMVFSLCLFFLWHLGKKLDKDKAFISLSLKMKPLMPISIFLIYVFLSGYYLSLQTEVPISRYALPYFPALSLAFSISIKIIIILIRRIGHVFFSSVGSVVPAQKE